MKKILAAACLLVSVAVVGCGGRTEEAPAAKQAATEAPKGMNDYMNKMKPPGMSGGAPASPTPPAASTPPAGDTPAAAPAKEPEKK